jgi:hypothetical protein
MSPNFAAAATVAITLGAAAAATTAQSDLVAVYCAAEQIDGFSAPGADDSAEDLRKSLADRDKTLRLVDSEADADIVVLVTGREEVSAGRTYDTQTYTTGEGKKKRTRTRTTSSEKTVNTVYATLRAGAFELELEGTSPLRWRSAAGDVSKQVEDWVEENRDSIEARRGQ